MQTDTFNIPRTGKAFLGMVFVVFPLLDILKLAFVRMGFPYLSCASTPAFVVFLFLAEHLHFFPTRPVFQHIICVLLALASTLLSFFIGMFLSLLIFGRSYAL